MQPFERVEGEQGLEGQLAHARRRQRGAERASGGRPLADLGERHAGHMVYERFQLRVGGQLGEQRQRSRVRLLRPAAEQRGLAEQSRRQRCIGLHAQGAEPRERVLEQLLRLHRATRAGVQPPEQRGRECDAVLVGSARPHPQCAP